MSAGSSETSTGPPPLVAGGGACSSKAPMSEPSPPSLLLIAGEVARAGEVALVDAAAERVAAVDRDAAGDAARGSGVGPPLSRSSGSRPAATPTRSLDLPKPQLPSSSRLKPPETHRVGAAFAFARRASATIELRVNDAGVHVVPGHVRRGRRTRRLQFGAVRRDRRAGEAHGAVAPDPTAAGSRIAGGVGGECRVAADRALFDDRRADLLRARCRRRSLRPCFATAQRSATLPLIVLRSIEAGFPPLSIPPPAATSSALPLASARLPLTDGFAQGEDAAAEDAAARGKAAASTSALRCRSRPPGSA